MISTINSNTGPSISEPIPESDIVQIEAGLLIPSPLESRRLAHQYLALAKIASQLDGQFGKMAEIVRAESKE